MITIKHRFTGAVLFECEIPPELAEAPAARQLGFAVKEALKARADLARAYLADAYLARADLARADLAGAYLARADLAGAYLAGADLAGADLAGAYLAGAYLAGAYLAGAYLADAYLARADLARADLAGAYLARAYLADAYLADANLADAYLAGANLADAYLADADLADAYLAGANLADADLADAYLAGAYLADAYLADANLADAYLAGANLADAYLAGAKNVPETNGSESVQTREPEPTDRLERQRLRAERFRARNPDVPVIPDLDARILGILESGKGQLRMSAWHTCETTHCRAGWAITLAGKAGKKLEEKYDSHRAGRMIYQASTGRVPHFFASDSRALEDIRQCAAEQSK
jgi:uncharacterized protein YjbI with pentapeptide repeats